MSARMGFCGAFMIVALLPFIPFVIILLIGKVLVWVGETALTPWVWFNGPVERLFRCDPDTEYAEWKARRAQRT